MPDSVLKQLWLVASSSVLSDQKQAKTNKACSCPQNKTTDKYSNMSGPAETAWLSPGPERIHCAPQNSTMSRSPHLREFLFTTSFIRGAPWWWEREKRRKIPTLLEQSGTAPSSLAVAQPGFTTRPLSSFSQRYSTCHNSLDGSAEKPCFNMQHSNSLSFYWVLQWWLKSLCPPPPPPWLSDQGQLLRK